MFHIRIRCSIENTMPLTDSGVADSLLQSVRFYTTKGRWFSHLFLLMPDHLHALLSFPKHETMSRMISEWKRYQTRTQGIHWQANYFDHRIRNTAEYLEKAAYIRNNPVVKGLCDRPEDWPWVS